ncbi:MAG: hypothetical protein K6B38_04920, partial [Ruminococcus sp.]|nr:hypothetical protein [Ruminococcus sp.]
GSKGDSIRLVRQYTNSGYQVETFEFADGNKLETAELFKQSIDITTAVEGVIKAYDSGYGTRDDIITGTEKADIIYGYSGNDTITGGKGNDTLYGGYGDDTYIFNLGDGQDTINEENIGSKADRIVFGEGITAKDIKVTRDGNDMVLLVGSKGDSIRLVRQYTNSGYQVETFEFADGTLSHADTSTSELVIDFAPENEAIAANTEILTELYSADSLNVELSTAYNNILASEDTVSISENQNISADRSDVQALLLIENMSAFSDSSNVYDSINISDITADTSSLDQLLTSSSLQ